MTSLFSWQNSINLFPASFCTPGPNLPVTPGISWPPTFAFQSPIIKRISFFGVSYRRSCMASQNCSTSASSAVVLGHRFELLWYWMLCFGNELRLLSCLRLHSNTVFQALVGYEVYSISSKGFLSTVVDKMIIWIKFSLSHPF